MNRFIKILAALFLCPVFADSQLTTENLASGYDIKNNLYDSIFLKYWVIEQCDDGTTQKKFIYQKWQCFRSLWESLPISVNDTTLLSTYSFYSDGDVYECATLKNPKVALLAGLLYEPSSNGCLKPKAEIIKITSESTHNLIDKWNPDSLRSIARWFSDYRPAPEAIKCRIKSAHIIFDGLNPPTVDTVSYKTWKLVSLYLTPSIIKQDKDMRDGYLKLINGKTSTNERNNLNYNNDSTWVKSKEMSKFRKQLRKQIKKSIINAKQKN